MIFRVPELTIEEVAVAKKIDALRATLAYSASQPRRWFGLLRRNTFVGAVRGSNSIEGYNVTFEDGVAAVEGLDPLDPKNEAWAAVAGYRMAMSLILQRADDNEFSYSADLLKSLHYIMIGHALAKNPGRWRPGAIFVRDGATGQIAYEGPPVESVPGLVAETLNSLNDAASAAPVMVRAAMAHLNLAMIHPFSDGNGRMARALQTLVLARSGIKAPLFSSIEEWLGRNSRLYYETLSDVGQGAWRPERDTRPWIRFCLTAHYKQAMIHLRRQRELQKLCDRIEAMVSKLGLPERSVMALADAAYGRQLRNPGYRVSADVSVQAAGRDLRFLVKAGLLVPHGDHKARYYLAADSLRQIREEVAERRYDEGPFDPAGKLRKASSGQ